MEMVSFFYVLFFSYKVASGGESCQIKNGNWTYCEHDCCGSWDDKRCCAINTTALILCIIAATMILAVVTFIVIYCHQAKKRKKPLVRPLTKPTEHLTTKPLDTSQHSKAVSSITYVVVPPGEPLYRVQDYPPPSLPPQPPPYADLENGVVSISETGYTYLHPMNSTLSVPPSYSGEQNTDTTNVERRKRRKKKRKCRQPKNPN